MDLFRVEKYNDWANPSWYADGLKLQSSTDKSCKAHLALPMSPLLVDQRMNYDEAKRIVKQLEIE